MTQHKYEPGGFFPCTICGEFENHLNHEIFDNGEDNKPGLTEARKPEIVSVRRGESADTWLVMFSDGVGAAVKHDVPEYVEAAIAAEARAPLEARIAELESMLRQMWSAGEVDGRNALIARAEDAERQLEKIREKLEQTAVDMRDEASFMDSNENYAKQMLRSFALRIERTLNPPASTAAEARAPLEAERKALISALTAQRELALAAERQLEEMREALRSIRETAMYEAEVTDDSTSDGVLTGIADTAERALTSPASTAKGDKDAE